ncbi:MAG TPA: sigma-70 family RNA polymerase sigma factor [Pyrinomonadaceae bacterium]|nr:sigma-70 family RNA polymerase sigma factor [Pyrinomonadaceae bacterium]
MEIATALSRTTDPGPKTRTDNTIRDSTMYATADMLLTSPAPAAPEQSHETAIEVVLVKAVLEGDRDGFTRLYDLYAPLVHGILLARVPRAEVDDLVQDIFLHAYKKLDTLRESSSFGPWIAMIARNRAVDFHRRSRETVEINDELRGSNTQDSRATEILELIRNLPEAYRETLVLRLVEGMTGPEIAVRTGLTAASVRVNLHRGMKLLREQLGFMEGL